MSEERVIIKDDSDLVEMIMEGRELRRQYGVPEPDTTHLSDRATLKAEWERMRQARGLRQVYHIVIEPANGIYFAYALSLPGIVVHGKTPQAAREQLAQALHSYLAELHTVGRPLPPERKQVEMLEISLMMRGFSGEAQ